MGGGKSSCQGLAKYTIPRPPRLPHPLPTDVENVLATMRGYDAPNRTPSEPPDVGPWGARATRKRVQAKNGTNWSSGGPVMGGPTPQPTFQAHQAVQPAATRADVRKVIEGLRGPEIHSEGTRRAVEGLGGPKTHSGS